MHERPVYYHTVKDVFTVSNSQRPSQNSLCSHMWQCCCCYCPGWCCVPTAGTTRDKALSMLAGKQRVLCRGHCAGLVGCESHYEGLPPSAKYTATNPLKLYFTPRRCAITSQGACTLECKCRVLVLGCQCYLPGKSCLSACLPASESLLTRLQDVL